MLPDLTGHVGSSALTRKPQILRLTWVLATLCQVAWAQDAPVFQWAGSFKVDGGNEDSYSYAVTTDASGNVYTTGSFNGVIDMDPGAGVFSLSSITYYEQDIFVSKLDANGNFAWAVRFGSSGNDYGYSVATDAAGNVYVTGQVYGGADFDPGPGVFPVTGTPAAINNYIVKLDTNGNLVWATTFGLGVGRGIRIDASGNVLTTGYFSGTKDFDPGSGTFNMTSAGGDDSFISKLDANGNFIWAKRFGGSTNDRSHSIDTDNSGNVITTGLFTGTGDFDPGTGVFAMTVANASTDTYVSKLDANGNFIWAKSMGGAQATLGFSSRLDGSGNVFFAGYFSGTVDFDPGPSTKNLVSTGNEDIFVGKLNSAGDLVWVNSLGGGRAESDRALGLTVDAAGNVLVTGYFNGLLDFDWGPGTYQMTTGTTTIGALLRDVYILKVTNDGNFIWARQQGNINYEDSGTGITTDAAGNIFVSGFFNTSTDFDFGPCNGTLNTSFNTDTNGFVESIRLGPTYVPTLTSVSPTSGPVGTVFTITGTDFSPILADNIVKFSSTLVPISAVTSTTITATVPSVPNGSYNTRLQVGCVSITNGPVFSVTGPLPTISSFAPTSGLVGTTVTITGTNFSATPASNTVKFNGTTATVSASTTTSITTSVPSGAITGKITVTVGGNTAISATNFTVTTAGGIVINPQPQSTTVCEGQNASFSLAASGASNITFQWQKFSGAAFANISNGGGYTGVTASTLTINTTGVFGAGDYRCKVSGTATPDVFSTTVTLTIDSAPTAPTTTGASDCIPAAITLTASGGIDGEYRWYTVATGGTAIAGQVNSSFTTPVINASLTYFVSIDNGTCESLRTSVEAHISNLASPVISITGNTSLCIGQSAGLSATAGFADYTWSTSETTQQIDVITAGDYFVTGIDDYGCTSPVSNTVTITETGLPCSNEPPVIAVNPLSIQIDGVLSVNLLDFISDADDNLDLATLSVLNGQTVGGIPAIIDGAYYLVIDYSGSLFSGSDQVIIEVCDSFGSCSQQTLDIRVVGDIVVYNAVSPNDDKKNDILVVEYIDLISNAQKNRVTIYNRWGDLVFEVNDYNNADRAFKGISNNGNELPSGTYFYKIEYESGKKTQTGYLVLQR